MLSALLYADMKDAEEKTLVVVRDNVPLIPVTKCHSTKIWMRIRSVCSYDPVLLAGTTYAVQVKCELRHFDSRSVENYRYKMVRLAMQKCRKLSTLSDTDSDL